jgi:DNA repair protein RadC
MPEDQRPYEKAINYGFESLTDSELLSIIIKNGTKGVSALSLSSRIINENEGKIGNIRKLSLEELTAFSGIGIIKAIEIKACAEIALRLVQSERRDKIKMCEPESVAGFFMEKLRYNDVESLYAAYFDSKMDLIGYEEISRGTDRMAPVSPKVILRKAILKQASFLIILHNHPSGDPAPSTDDIETTKCLKKCGDIMDIPLRDHIIIGDNNYYSFCEQGLLN